MDEALGTTLISNAGLRFPPSPPQFPLPEESQSLEKGRLPPINVCQELQPSHSSTEMASFISLPSARARWAREQQPAAGKKQLLHLCRARRFSSTQHVLE